MERGHAFSIHFLRSLCAVEGLASLVLWTGMSSPSRRIPLLLKGMNKSSIEQSWGPPTNTLLLAPAPSIHSPPFSSSHPP